MDRGRLEGPPKSEARNHGMGTTDDRAHRKKGVIRDYQADSSELPYELSDG